MMNQSFVNIADVMHDGRTDREDARMPSKGHDVGSWHNNASERTWSKHSSLTGDRRAIHRLIVARGHLSRNYGIAFASNVLILPRRTISRFPADSGAKGKTFNRA